MYLIQIGLLKQVQTQFKEGQLGVLFAFVQGLKSNWQIHKEEHRQSQAKEKIDQSRKADKHSQSHGGDFPRPPDDLFYEHQCNDEGWDINNHWNQVL